MLKGKTAAALSLGCKVNQYETDGMTELLKNSGVEMVDFNEKADIYIVNTCSVTNIADKKSRQMLHKARKMNPDAIIVAVGCYAQAAKDKLLNEDGVSIVIGNNKKKDIVDIICKYMAENKNNEYLTDISSEKEFEPLEISRTREHTRAYVKIQDGCNQFCTYCIIPYLRGRIRSRDLDSIITEVTKLAEAGVKEIVLTGIHISSYGYDKENGIYLADVIDEVSKIEPIQRIRLGSLEPGIITGEFVDRISKNKKVCPHFHLSLQSGCDTVLKRMNRKYTCTDYFEKCELLRSAYDRPALTTDVIVGFPGETDEEFEKTYKYLEKLNLYEMHIFKYSPREGTVAAAMENQIPPEVKNTRSDRLISLSERNKAAYEASFYGENVDVLVEKKLIKDGRAYFRGHTERYIDVLFPAEDMEKKNDMMDNAAEDITNTIVSVPYTYHK